MLADSLGSEIMNLPVAGYGSTAISCGVLPNGMFSSFSKELTAILPQVLQQVAPSHGTTFWGTQSTWEAACIKRYIGSSKSDSKSVLKGRVGVGLHT